MKALVEFILSIRLSELWYFNYGAWGIFAFLFYTKGYTILASIYAICCVIAYGIAHALLKQEKQLLGE